MTIADVAAPALERIALRFTGDASALSGADRQALMRRESSAGENVLADAARIVAAVRARGDDVLFEMARKLDGVDLDRLEVPRAEMRRALDTLPAPLRQAMERSARNIAAVHRAFQPSAIEAEPEPGIIVGRRPDPLARVGIYAPGGRATYPSSVLMAAIPARVAGVAEIVLASPPDATGRPSQAVLAAAALCDVDRVFAIGGAGAVAAMALGTESVPRVDRVVGPGNAWVATAKQLLVADVGIDSPAGPSELLVVADDRSDPELVVGEMIAQAEHDPMACVVALVAGESMAVNITELLRARAAKASRAAIVANALAGQGGVLRVENLESAIELANEYASEHLLLAVESADALLPLVRNAGTVFLGATTSVVFGDYMTGANHVLPTGGSARRYSGLSPLDFVRWTTYQRVSSAAARSLASDVAAFADAEQLPAHAAAALRWRASP